jgi:4-azaleucine resistance transporter AzlC
LVIERFAPGRGFREGVKVGLGFAAGSFLLAVAFGAVARAEGWGTTAPIAASLVIFSGSAQFTLASTLGGGGGVITAVAAAALINARFVPMSLAIAPSLRGGRWRRALEGQAVVDGSWAFAHVGRGRFDRERLIGATLPQWPAWVAGTVIGVYAAPSKAVSSTLGLDVIFPAFFLVLLLSELRTSRHSRITGLASATIAALLSYAFPVGLVVLVTTSLMLVAHAARTTHEE